MCAEVAQCVAVVTGGGGISPSMHGVPSPGFTGGLSVLYVDGLLSHTALIQPVRTKPYAPIKEPPPFN